MRTSATEGAGAFCSYYRPDKRAPWTKLAEAATWDEAWALLLARLPPGKGGESLVLPRGQDPNASSCGRVRR